MAKGKALDGKPYAGNPHVRFDEGEVAPAATPRRGSLLYKTKNLLMVACTMVAVPSLAIMPTTDELKLAEESDGERALGKTEQGGVRGQPSGEPGELDSVYTGWNAVSAMGRVKEAVGATR